MTPIFKGIIERSRLHLDDNDKFRDYIAHLGQNIEVEVIVRKRRKKRSLAENNYYWGVVIAMLVIEMGLEDKQVHEFLKKEFLLQEIEIKGKMYKIIRSTTDLSTVEMEQYLERVRTWAATELSCRIPLPNEIDIDSGF